MIAGLAGVVFGNSETLGSGTCREDNCPIWLQTHQLHKHSLVPSSTILDEAKELVYGPREDDYGDAFNDMDRVAKMWSAILDTRVTAEQVPLCMIAIKISRLCHAFKRDSLVDIPGWSAVLEKVIATRGKS